MNGATQQVHSPGVPAIRSFARSPSFAGVRVRVVVVHAGKKQYLAIFQNKSETSGNRPERAKGICRISHSAEEQLGSGKGGRLPA